MARKKTRSAAQKRATRKLVALNRRKGHKPRRKAAKRRSSPVKRTRRAAKRKTIKRKTSHKRTVAKKGIFDKIPLIKSPMFRQAAAGVGTAALGSAVLALVIPSLASHPIVKPVLALAGGGAIGAVAQVLTQGGIAGLNIGSLGGGGNSANVQGAGNTGFA